MMSEDKFIAAMLSAFHGPCLPGFTSYELKCITSAGLPKSPGKDGGESADAFMTVFEANKGLAVNNDTAHE